MKTIKILQVIMFTILFAGVISIPVSAKKPVNATGIQIHKVIKESIKYPETALKNGCCGTAVVIFSLNKDGSIKVNSIKTDSDEIATGIKAQLSKIAIKDLSPVANQQYKVKITFKLT